MYVVKEGTSKQAWLNTVQLCPRCGGQHPKTGFKRVGGVDICAECQEDELAPNRYHEEAVAFSAAWVATEMLQRAKLEGRPIPPTPSKELVMQYLENLSGDIIAKVRWELAQQR